MFVDFLPKIKLEIAIDDDLLQTALDAITKAAKYRENWRWKNLCL